MHGCVIVSDDVQDELAEYKPRQAKVGVGTAGGSTVADAILR